MRGLVAIICASIVAFAAASPAWAGQAECYDARVVARPVRQIPSEILPCPDDCIIISWPWFVDLKVSRVLEGQAVRGTTEVLTVQHTHFIPRSSVWFLRRNDVGSFNVIREEGANLARCTSATPPARAYIAPGPSETMADLRRRGKGE